MASFLWGEWRMGSGEWPSKLKLANAPMKALQLHTKLQIDGTEARKLVRDGSSISSRHNKLLKLVWLCREAPGVNILRPRKDALRANACSLQGKMARALGRRKRLSSIGYTSLAQLFCHLQPQSRTA